LQGAGGPPPPPLLQLAVLPSSALSNDTAPEDDEAAGTVELKIINGEQAPVEQFGFMVALLQQGRFFCGGTLLDALTVLTGAPGSRASLAPLQLAAEIADALGTGPGGRAFPGPHAATAAPRTGS
jgi:hypothetical protein